MPRRGLVISDFGTTNDPPCQRNWPRPQRQSAAAVGRVVSPYGETYRDQAAVALSCWVSIPHFVPTRPARGTTTSWFS